MTVEERIAEVLRLAARPDSYGRPRGIHVAVRELGAEDVDDAVWSAFYSHLTYVKELA